jgi:hypothetical protein
MLHGHLEDVGRKPADIVGPEPELHCVGEIDLDIELLGRRVRGGSRDGAQQDEAKAKPSTALATISAICTTATPTRRRNGRSAQGQGARV